MNCAQLRSNLFIFDIRMFALTDRMRSVLRAKMSAEACQPERGRRFRFVSRRRSSFSPLKLGLSRYRR